MGKLLVIGDIPPLEKTVDSLGEGILLLEEENYDALVMEGGIYEISALRSKWMDHELAIIICNPKDPLDSLLQAGAQEVFDGEDIHECIHRARIRMARLRNFINGTSPVVVPDPNEIDLLSKLIHKLEDEGHAR